MNLQDKDSTLVSLHHKDYLNWAISQYYFPSSTYRIVFCYATWMHYDEFH